MADVIRLQCDDCENTFSHEDEVGPLYECSRCGAQHPAMDLEGNRCPECNVFMAKVSDIACPDCYHGEASEVELWEGADGLLFKSEEGERQWLEDAPKREAEDRKRDRETAELEAMLNRRRKLERDMHWAAVTFAMDLIEDEDAVPNMMRSFHHQIESIEGWGGGVVSVPIDLRELYPFVTGKAMPDRPDDWDAERRLAGELYEEILTLLPLPERYASFIRSTFASFGSMPHVDAPALAAAVVAMLNTTPSDSRAVGERKGAFSD